MSVYKSSADYFQGGAAYAPPTSGESMDTIDHLETENKSLREALREVIRAGRELRTWLPANCDAANDAKRWDDIMDVMEKGNKFTYGRLSL